MMTPPWTGSHSSSAHPNQQTFCNAVRLNQEFVGVDCLLFDYSFLLFFLVREASSVI